MALQTVVTFEQNADLSQIHLEDHKRLDVLGKREAAAAIQIKELLSSVSESVREAIEDEGELTVEIEGSLKMSAGAGIKYLLFNVGTDSSKVNTMKVTLKTKVSPKKRIAEV